MTGHYLMKRMYNEKGDELFYYRNKEYKLMQSDSVLNLSLFNLRCSFKKQHFNGSQELILVCVEWIWSHFVFIAWEFRILYL